MERRPPYADNRPKIPGGYGNYPGRDPESPPPETRGRRGHGTKGPWGGHFEGQAEVPLPTAPWEAGIPGYRNNDEVEWYRAQQQQQQRQQQHAGSRRAPAAGTGGSVRGQVGGGETTAAAGNYTSGSSGGLGSEGVSPEVLEGMRRGGYRSAAGAASATSYRRRQSPLVTDAPRLTVLPPLVRPGDRPPQVDVPIETASKEQGGAAGTGAAGAAGKAGSISRQHSAPRSTSGNGRVGGSVAEGSSSGRRYMSSSARERDGGMGVARGGGGGGGFGGGGRISDRNKDSATGFGAVGAPSPFLSSRSVASNTWRSPLEQSAVNPFSASFDVENRVSPRGGIGRVVGGEWLGGGGDGGSRGDRGARGGGYRTGEESGQPLLFGDVGGGYGSRWDGGGGAGAEAKVPLSSSSKKPKSSGHKVDDQGTFCGCFLMSMLLYRGCVS